MSKRTHSRNAFETQLNGAITAGATAITLDSVSGLIDPLYLVIDPESPTKREYIRADGIAGSQLTSVTRGLDGSAAGAQAHDSGTRVRAVATHQLISDLFDDIETAEADIAALEAADANHFGGTDTDDHPEATTGVRGFMSSADKTKLDALDLADQVTGGDSHDHVGGDGAQIDHVNLAGLLTGDPHTQYHNDSRHDARQLIYHGDINMIRSGGLQSIPSGIRTVVTYDGSVVDNDPGNHMTVSIGAGTITFNTAGTYLVSAGIRFQDAITSGLILYALYIGLDSVCSQSLMGVTGLGPPLMAISRQLVVIPGTVVTAEILHNAGSARDIDAGFDTFIQATRLR